MPAGEPGTVNVFTAVSEQLGRMRNTEMLLLLVLPANRKWPRRQTHPQALGSGDSVRERGAMNGRQRSLEQIHLEGSDRAVSAVRNKQAGAQPGSSRGYRRQRKVTGAGTLPARRVSLEKLYRTLCVHAQGGRTVVAIGYVIVGENILLGKRIAGEDAKMPARKVPMTVLPSCSCSPHSNAFLIPGSRPAGRERRRPGFVATDSHLGRRHNTFSSQLRELNRRGVGKGGRATHHTRKSIQNVLQTDSPVNGVVLREKKVPPKRRAAR